MPDLTHSTSSRPPPGQSSHATTEVRSKQSIKIPKVPKVLKSLQRKPERSYHTLKSSKYHHSHHYYHNYNHLVTSRVKTTGPKERREEWREGGRRREERKEEERRVARKEVRREDRPRQRREEVVPVRQEEAEEARERQEEEEERTEEEEEEEEEEMNRASLDELNINFLRNYPKDEPMKIRPAPSLMPPTPLLPPSPPDHDMGDLLTCPVCMESYTTGGRRAGGREPLFLSCHHSMCAQCLPRLMRTHTHSKHTGHGRDVSEVTCPECRVVSLVPPGGLTQNFYLVSLIETKAARSRYSASRLRMWCSECDSVALEGCSDHPLTHLPTVLSTATTTYTTTAARLSTLLLAQAEEQGEAGRRVRHAVGSLEKATSCLKRRLIRKLDNATLAQATATSLLAEVEQMSKRVGCDVKTKDILNKNEVIPSSKYYNRAFSSPATEVEGTSVGKEGQGKKLKKSRSDLTDLMVAMALGGSYHNMNDDANPLSSSSSSPPSIPSSFNSSSLPLSIPPYPGSPSVSSTLLSPSPSIPSSSVSTSPPLSSSTSSFIPSALHSPSTFPSKSTSLTSSPSSSPPDSPYLSSNSQEQEAKILLLKKCVEALEAMEATLKERGGNMGEKERDGGVREKDGEVEGEGWKGGVRGSVREDSGSFTKEMFMQMFQTAVDALE